MQTQKFIRKVRPVEAIQVTENNLSEIAGWCGGLVVPINGLGGSNDQPYVHVTVVNPRNDADSQAFPGMWIVKEDYRRFRVVNPKQFKNSYEPHVVERKPASPKAMPQKRPEAPADPSGLTQATPAPIQVGAVAVDPGTPPTPGSSLTTGTSEVNRSAVTGEFVSDAVAEANPDTTVTETIKHQEDNVQDHINHDELATEDLEKIDAHSPGGADEIDGAVDMELRDVQQAEADPDGTVQLGVPVAGTPSLCGVCGSPVLEGLCSNDPGHDVNGQAPVTADESATGTEG